MTQYSRVHVFGKVAHGSDIERQNARAARKTQWANNNEDKLLTADELAQAIKDMERNPPVYKSKPRKRSNPKKIDTNYVSYSKKRKNKKKRGMQ